jgi:hypothetical protein
LFFTVGHISVKILTFLDDQEDLAKRIIGRDNIDGREGYDNELEDICGGK